MSGRMVNFARRGILSLFVEGSDGFLEGEMTMRHFGKGLRIWLNLVLLITLIVGCSRYGGQGRASYLCKYMTPFSFSLMSDEKMIALNKYDPNWSLLFLSRVDACFPYHMV